MKTALKICSIIYLIKKHILLIAHNANYDCRFVLKHLTNERPLVKGGRILSCAAVYKKQPTNIKIKDSFRIINMPLKDFGKSFKLDVEKEIMPYQLYTQEDIEKVLCTNIRCRPIDDHNL